MKSVDINTVLALLILKVVQARAPVFGLGNQSTHFACVVKVCVCGCIDLCVCCM